MKIVPAALADHVLPFDWDVRELWRLEEDTRTVPLAELDHLLDLPFWSSVPGRGMLFDISPREAIASPGRSPHQERRILDADISFPIGLLLYRDRLWILDGVHRLAKLSVLGSKTVRARLHPETVIPKIIVSHPEPKPPVQ